MHCWALAGGVRRQLLIPLTTIIFTFGSKRIIGYGSLGSAPMGAAVVDTTTPVPAEIPGLSVSGLAQLGSWLHSTPGSRCDGPAGQSRQRW